MRWLKERTKAGGGADVVLMLLELVLMVGIVSSRASDRTTPGFLARNAPHLEWLLFTALGLAVGYALGLILRGRALGLAEWMLCALPLWAYVLATWWLSIAIPETNVAAAGAYTLFALFATTIKVRSRKESM